MHRSNIRPLLLAGIAALALGTGCIPYTVGSTAQTVAEDERTFSRTVYFIPNGLKDPGDSIAVPLYGADTEWRYGVGPRSDVGLRLLPAGAVINYKHRMGTAPAGRPSLAYMVGTGIVNGGEHLHLEATLIASGDERSSLMPFGGLRAMQVMPLSQGAVHDSPTLGAFGGLQFGGGSMTLRPEIGVYYDRSALGIRPGNVIVVPSFTISRRRKDEGSGYALGHPKPSGIAGIAARTAAETRSR